MAISIRANMNTMEVILPLGIYLKKDDKVHDICVVKAMDGNDEEMISEKRVRNNGAKIVTALLGRKIIKVGDHSFPDGIGEKIASEMFIEDRDTCLVAIRKLMKDEMVIDAKCPRCGGSTELVLSMSQMLEGIKQWDDLKLDNRTSDLGVLTFELPDGLFVTDDQNGDTQEYLCRKGKLKLPNGKIETEMAKLAKNSGEANSKLLAECVIEFEHLRRVDEDVVKAMTRRDREYLTSCLEEAKGGPNFLIDVECEDCDNEFKFMTQLPYFFTVGRSQKK